MYGLEVIQTKVIYEDLNPEVGIHAHKDSETQFEEILFTC